MLPLAGERRRCFRSGTGARFLRSCQTMGNASGARAFGMIRRICLLLGMAAVVSSQALAEPASRPTEIAWNTVVSADGSQSASADAGTGQIEPDIEQRLRDNLSSEMLQSFGLFIYVSKAEVGPWAQHMVVFQKAGDELLPLYDWPVSTGRETVEVNALGKEMSTTTPPGYYELDPKRFFVDYRSTQWDEAMPYAMFFNWKDHGVPTGLAIHAATDVRIGQLGTRASAGCVRLSPENAQTLFELIRNNYKGMVPKFGFDKYTGTVMNNGLLVHDGDGNLQLMPGYRVLVYIDDYGGQNLEARAY